MPTLLEILDTPEELRPDVPLRPGELIDGTPLGALIDKHARENAAQLDHEDRTRREQTLANTIDKLMTAELEAEIASTWPTAETRETYRREFKSFRAWCERVGVGALPAKGSTVATYLAACAADGADKAWFPLAAEAIRFIHTASGNFLDDVPVAAALRWAAKLDDVTAEPPTQH